MTETVLREVTVIPDSLETKTYSLSPNDLFPNYAILTITWPLFFNYDIDGEKFTVALKKFLEKYPVLCGRARPHEDMKFVIQVEASAVAEMGVPFTEYKAELSLAEVILEHMQVKVDEMDSVCFYEVPFFVSKLEAMALFQGEEPLMRVKLTHLQDGCVLSVAVQHIVLDGQRYFEALRDLGAAYRGLEVPDRNHDRSYLWPDQLAKFFPSLGDDVAKLPRKVLLSEPPVPLSSFPKEPGKTHMFHFSDETLANMEAVVKPYLSEGEYVSRNDIILAFFWVMNCELFGEAESISNGADLGVNNTFIVFSYEVLKNGYAVVPENYSGNAFTLQMVNNMGEDFSQSSLQEVFAKLAITVRKHMLALKEDSSQVARALMVHYQMLSTGQYPSMQFKDGLRGGLTNVMKTPVNEIDFGQGPPAWTHIRIYPLALMAGCVGPGPRNDGMLVFLPLLDSQHARFKSSAVCSAVAPGVTDIYADCTKEELKKMLGTE